MPDDEHAQLTLELGLPPSVAAPTLDWPPPTRTGTPGSPLPAGRLDGFTTSLFVHGYISGVRDLAQLIAHTGVGAVLCVEHIRNRPAFRPATAAADFLRRKTLTTNLLVDRNHYSGAKRKKAREGISRQWIEDQHLRMHLPWAMTDSGFSRDIGDVRWLLAAGAKLDGQIVVALPMRHELLRDRAPDVVDLVNAQPHPVAIMLEHKRDPFDADDVATAMSHLAQHATPGAMLLRSDTSALGAISHGAVVGAVGTRSGLRHIYPIPDKRAPVPEQLAYVVPDLLGYYGHVRVARALLQQPRLATWRCPCWFCSGRDLTWIAGQPEILRFRAGAQHSVAALAELGRRLHDDSVASGGVVAWDRMCAAAQEQHGLVAAPRSAGWKPKPALGQWRKATSTARPVTT